MSQRSSTLDFVKQQLRFDDRDDIVEFNTDESPLHIKKSVSNGRVPSDEGETSVRTLIGFCVFLVTISCLLISFGKFVGCGLQHIYSIVLKKSKVQNVRS